MAIVHQNLGAIYEEKGMHDDAIGEYKQAIQLGPNEATQAYNNLAWLYAQQGTNLEEALSLAEKAKELNPGDGNVLDTLGLIYYLNQMYDKAIISLESAKVSLPDDPTIRYHLGMAYYKKGSKEKALSELNRALEIDRNFPKAAEIRQTVKELEG
jgi:tetratricopeptide (TPR) repeat protein